MSKRSRERERKTASAQATGAGTRKRVGWIVAALALAVGGAYFWKAGHPARATVGAIASLVKTSATECQQLPPFALRAGMKPPFGIDLRGSRQYQVKLVEPGSGKILALPGWNDFGAFNGYTLDRDGNVFLVPAPFRHGTAGVVNKVDQFNKLYRIDGTTGVMADFTKLPAPTASRAEDNPVGTTGVTYDCATASLYAASVAGSGPDAERGTVYQLDPATGKVRARFDGFDALGIAVCADDHERRLYLASARKPELWSLALDAEGGFVGNPRREVSLLDQPGGADDRGYVIKFDDRGHMEVRAAEFGFSLIHGNDPVRNIYHFKHMAGPDGWKFLEITRKSSP